MPYRKPTNWITLAIILASVVVATFGVVTYQNTVAVRQGETSAAHSYEVREETRRLLSWIKDMETGQREYLLTGDPTYLDSYFEGRDRAEGGFELLRSLTADNDDQHRHVDELEALFHQRQGILLEGINLRNTPPGTPLNAEALQIVVSGRGKKLMEEIDGVVTEILDAEAQILAKREEDAEALAALSESFIISGNVLALMLFVLTGLVALVDRRKRDQAEAVMRSSEAELAAIFNSAPDGIIMFTENLSVHLMNPAAAKMYLCDAEESVHDSLLTFIPLRFHDVVTAELRDFFESMETKRFYSDRVAVRSDGTEFPCEYTSMRIVVGGKQFVTLRFHDLSESKATRAKLRQQAEMLNQVRDAILLCDMNDRILFWNRGSQLLYGLSDEQAIGQNVAEVLFAKQRSSWEAGRRLVLEQGVYSTELSTVDKDGRAMMIEHRRSLIRDEAGEPAAQLIINFDITSRKLREANERRSQRLESIGVLAGGIAHDLNNVLTPILMGGKLLKRADSNRERLADTIVASADRGAQMIKKLLAFAGGEAGVQERIDVHEILREAEDILRHTLPMTIELQVDCSDDLYAVSGDATELSQVILNLAINARDAMPDGGRLELRAANFQVEPSQNERGDDLQAGPHVLITVHDTGTGIPRSIIDRIFDPFFTTKEQGNGTGLGLATSLGIVRTHGGDITVSSEPGQGTTFTILLPATEQELGPRDSTEIGSSSAGNGEMILLVDDEPLIVETTRATLEAAGYQVNTAAGGAEAVAVYREKADTIDLVILDMMMPGIDGFATKDRLRDINPSVRVIASSGFRRPSDEGGRMNDVQGFLPKPYSDEQLLRLIRNVLDEKLHPESD